MNAKHRTRRLRKKLRLGEFQEMAFELRTEPNIQLSPQAEDHLLDSFLDELVEPRSLAMIGSMTLAYISYGGRGSVTEADRDCVRVWLLRRPEFRSVIVGELFDSWHGQYDDSTQDLAHDPKPKG